MSLGEHPSAGVSNLSEELVLLVENVLDYAIFVLSPAGEIRSWNAGAERALGYTAGEVIGSNFSRFYTPEDIESEKPRRELIEAEKNGRSEDESWATDSSS